MRIRYLGNIHDMLYASAETLADEYLSIVQAVDHEFRDDAERGRYSALVDAYGMHTHAVRFPAALAERGSAMLASRPFGAVKPVCSHCGSDSLARDASARWDVDTQQWEVSGVYDCTFCDTCSAERVVGQFEFLLPPIVCRRMADALILKRAFPSDLRRLCIVVSWDKVLGPLSGADCEDLPGCIGDTSIGH